MVHVVKCSCCGEVRGVVAGLQCDDEIRICLGCVGWFREKLAAIDVTPILPVLDMAVTAAFYDAAGFDVQVYSDDHETGRYAFVRYNEDSVFDLAVHESAVGAGCYLRVSDVDDWHTRLSELGYSVTPVQVEPWGMREFALTDPSGNHLRFGCATS